MIPLVGNIQNSKSVKTESRLVLPGAWGRLGNKGGLLNGDGILVTEPDLDPLAQRTAKPVY